MCGRYDNLIAREAYRLLFKPARLPESNFPPRYNIAPTDQIPIVRVDPRDGERELVMARWGLIPFWMKEKPKIPHINARAETVDTLSMFREAFAERRCLIPATGFFEWQKRDDGKQPYRFVRRDLEPFAFAGVWEFARLDGQEILSAAIIVGKPNPLVAGVPRPNAGHAYARRLRQLAGPGHVPQQRQGNAASVRGGVDDCLCGEPVRQQRQERQPGLHRTDR
jgi:putative SOS response-associated peptidase YedK